MAGVEAVVGDSKKTGIGLYVAKDKKNFEKKIKTNEKKYLHISIGKWDIV
jgi:hypothetical protein